MNIFLSEATISAVSCSMHCLEPGKDALYDIQLAPMKSQKAALRAAADVTWGVFAQYARNGEDFKWATKVANVSKFAAVNMYQSVRGDRLEHGYLDVVELRESDLRQLKSHAINSALTGLPHLNAYHESVFLASGYFFNNLPQYTSLSVGVLAVYADLALGLPDGVVQVPQFCASMDHDVSALAQQLTPEMQQWLHSKYAEVDDTLQEALTVSSQVLRLTA